MSRVGFRWAPTNFPYKSMPYFPEKSRMRMYARGEVQSGLSSPRD